MGLIDSHPYTYLPQDHHDNALVCIDPTHHEVHEGAMHEVHYEALTPTSGLTTYLHLETGDTNLHAYFEFTAYGGNLKIFMYDAATVGTAGTAITAHNMNRTFTDTLKTKVYLNSTVGTTGTAFATKTILAGSAATAKAVTSVKEGAERVWAPNTDYVIAIQTTTTGQAFTVDAILGEHD